MPDFKAALTDSRLRVVELSKGLSDVDLGRMVPACPAWTVKDLIGHLVGLSKDITTGNLEGLGSNSWTSAQIEAAKEKTVEELLVEWDEIATMIEDAIELVHPAMAGALIGDLVTHEHDLRGALERPGERDSSGVEVALDSYARFFGRRIKNEGLAALELWAGDQNWQLGYEAPRRSVSGPPFEMLRALTGRRTHEEIRAFDWSHDAEPYVALFSMYGSPQESLNE
jgi:uncharacterized protein (TIGR03083 family)